MDEEKVSAYQRILNSDNLFVACCFERGFKSVSRRMNSNSCNNPK